MNFGDFIDKRWGDLIAILMLGGGVSLVCVARGNTEILALGHGLLLAGGVTLRPASKNGNGAAH